jgi:hypothetical protein
MRIERQQGKQNFGADGIDRHDAEQGQEEAPVFRYGGGLRASLALTRRRKEASSPDSHRPRRNSLHRR